MTALLRRHADWNQVVRAAQEDARDDDAWACRVASAARDLFSFTVEPALAIVEHSPSCDSATYATLTMPNVGPPPDAAIAALGVAGFRAFFYPARVTTTFVEIERAAPPEAAARAYEFRRSRDFGDALGIFGYPEPGIVLSLFVIQDRELRLSRHERTSLSRLALHLEAAYRLRRRPAVVKAVLDADGRVLERSEDAPPGDVLTAHAERMKGAQRTLGHDALELWPALVDGRMSVINRGSGASRRLLVIENTPSTQPIRALSPTEVEVVSQAARGHSTKMIAYALGVTSSTVSLHLASAASKIGVASRMDLIRLAAMLTRDPRARFTEIALSDAERDILELLQQGLSNEAIAAIRSRSVRTIANQVASLLRKTQSSSRRELLARRRT